jgi:mannose-6-phosphate isomerase
MPATRLSTIRINKPWGRHELWPGFEDAPVSEDAVGEIWFKAGDDAPEPDLLVKYLFTSERLSIQVHPDDAAARAAGHARGKDEAWLILSARPGSSIALGPRHCVTAAELYAAALDGSIETLLHWRSVKSGDVIYAPAGTIHAIGAGLTLIEVQQNIDLTYRLYDYGRPRELHLEAGVAVANLSPFIDCPAPAQTGTGRDIVIEGGKFVIERISANTQLRLTQPAWLIPVTGSGTVDGHRFSAGECWLVSGAAAIQIDKGSQILLAYCRDKRT